jgi:hypothetical protein
MFSIAIFKILKGANVVYITVLTIAKKIIKNRLVLPKLSTTNFYIIFSKRAFDSSFKVLPSQKIVKTHLNTDD